MGLLDWVGEEISENRIHGHREGAEDEDGQNEELRFW